MITPKFLKRIHISKNEWWMFAIVAAATLARFLLIYFNWPVTNSDEGNMGLLALHVAFQGDHPTFFYGLPYMAPLEGYIAAPLFRIFGISLFTLRIGLLPLFATFLICMYYLTRLLYTEKFALTIVILLSLGSYAIIYLQIKAVGEYPETELFFALIPLLASWLALTSYSFIQREARRSRQKRILIYGLLGLIVGLALWVDFVILPVVATAGLLLLLFCYRELLSWKGLSLLMGVIIGAFPLILYNLTTPWNQNSLSILLWIQQDGAKEIIAQRLTWVNHIVGTMMISLPGVSGANPDCPLTAFPSFGSPNVATLPCIIFHGIWGAGYLILLIVATSCAVYAVWQSRHYFFSQHEAFENRQVLIYQCCRLMILVSVILTLLSYVTSPKSAVPPVTSYRYLLYALIAVPAILWPLWNGLRPVNIQSSKKLITTILLRGGLLLLIFLTFISGTLRTFANIPAAQVAYQQEGALVHDLLKIHATRIYSEYWTCNRLIFRSQEQIICSVLDDQLKPGFDRYLPYRSIVRAAPHPTYIFPLGSQPADILKHQMQSTSKKYREYTFEGYLVFQTI
ncbi:MAG: ArnT family glycosyltransferase [Ktedonobacteraceae bacterium]